LSAPPSAEPELKVAVADLDAAPAARAPTSVPISAPTAPAAEPESMRRRSTVRERAPVTGGEEAPLPSPAPSASPAPEPAVNEANEAADGDRPRRTGWWSRRFAGG
jgi:ribonuclease E